MAGEKRGGKRTAGGVNEELRGWRGDQHPEKKDEKGRWGRGKGNQGRHRQKEKNSKKNWGRFTVLNCGGKSEKHWSEIKTDIKVCRGLDFGGGS